MANLPELEKLLPSLSRGEKAQLLKWVVQEFAVGSLALCGREFPFGFSNRRAASAPPSQRSWMPTPAFEPRIWPTPGPLFAHIRWRSKSRSTKTSPRKWRVSIRTKTFQSKPPMN